MKKWLLLLATLGLVACSTPNVNWQQGNLAMIEQTAIQLESNLWTDQMPKAGAGAQSQNLNGTLRLETSDQLPADLTVSEIVIKQGDSMWIIDGDMVELRTESDNRWEVVFQSGSEVNIDRSVSVALGLSDSQGEIWLVQHKVSIDKVY
ncbi:MULTISPECIES: hypothetical protein [Vibrio]|uniref:DNA polymerase III subunit beta n=1 Tax=Vibrio ostreae TaxID=2841925 RepID=A0A975YMW9_9VIBR|nr:MULTISPECIES: hypothetical protein [Vibrio]QXO16890.1 hypothetical protein KNV97_15630 [Vibrio ostreae]WGY46105.1 hypothetical protein J0X00_14840 [Vibrio sp. ABG19]